MSKCVGCGILLQNEHEDMLGYVSNISDNLLCQRCFRIRNYSDYKTVIKDNNEFFNILKSINSTKDLVVLVVDVFNISNNLNIIRKYLNNDILIVLTKRDLLPKSVNDIKLIEYIRDFNLNQVDTVVISSNKNYNFDNLYNLINKYKKSNDVYIVGFTNAGKSTMINKLIYNYSSCSDMITTSFLPSTTLDNINIKLNDELNIIDTPGILFEGSFYDILNGKDLKKIIPKKEIKPLSYQIKGKQFILVDKFLKLGLSNINVVLYMSNNLNVKRYYKDIETVNFVKHHLKVCNSDIVVEGLGFIKVIGCGYIDVYTFKDVCVYIRNSLI